MYYQNYTITNYELLTVVRESVSQGYYLSREHIQVGMAHI